MPRSSSQSPHFTFSHQKKLHAVLYYLYVPHTTTMLSCFILSHLMLFEEGYRSEMPMPLAALSNA